MLTSDLKSPFVSDTLVTSNFIKSFDVLSELGFEDVRSHLEVLSFLVIFLSVQKPSWHSVSFRIVDNVGNTVTLGFSHLSGSESWVDSEDFANKETESSSDTLNLIQCVWNGSLTIDVGVKNTMNMLEVTISVFDDE
jgi:hypothetical protein